MALAGTGAGFQEDIKKSVVDDWICIKLSDDMGGFKGVKNICDFIIASGRALFLAELKSYKTKSIPLANITQRSDLLEHAGKRNIFPCLLLNFRAIEKTYYLDIKTLDLITDRKSISIKFCQENGIEIPETKLRTHFRYDLENLERQLYSKGRLIGW